MGQGVVEGAWKWNGARIGFLLTECTRSETNHRCYSSEGKIAHWEID